MEPTINPALQPTNTPIPAQQIQYPYHRPVNKTIPALSHETYFAFISIILGYFYCRMNRITGNNGIGTTIYQIVLCIFTAMYLKKAKGCKQNATSIFMLISSLLFALYFMIFNGEAESVVSFFGFNICYIIWVAASSGCILHSKKSSYIGYNLGRSAFAIPFGECGNGIKTASDIKKKHVLKRASAVLIGILLTIPLAAVILMLLGSADALFGQLMRPLLHILPNIDEYFILNNLRCIILGIPVGLYLCGLVIGHSRVARMNLCRKEAGDDNDAALDKAAAAHFYPDFTDIANTVELKKLKDYTKTTATDLDAKAAKKRLIPSVTLITMLTVLNAIYAVFLTIQFPVISAAFSNYLPENMTYAEYARSGFFQLFAVAMINLFVIIAVMMLHKELTGRAFKVLRIENTVLCLFTIGLSVTAFRRMYLYISVYGLTRLRVYTSLFMIYLIIVFAACIIRQFKEYNAAGFSTAVGVVFALFFVFGNIDSNIAAYNLRAVEAGTLEAHGVVTALEGSGAMVQIADYESRLTAEGTPEDDPLLSELRYRLTYAHSDIKRSEEFDIQSYALNQKIEAFRKQHP